MALRFGKIAVLAIAVALGAACQVLAQVPTENAKGEHAAKSEQVTHDDHAKGEHGPEIGHAEGKSNPLEFQTDLAIWTAAVFLVLLLVLKQFAWGPISAGLDKREQRIADHIAAAEKAHLDAKAMLAEYERKIAGTADEVRAIIDEARRDAEFTQQEILAKARADAQAEKERGIREIETATNQALKQLAETSANLAVEMAGKILRAQINPADHTKLIEENAAKFMRGSPSKN